MNKDSLNYLLEVISLASAVASGVLTGDARKGAQVSEALVLIVQKTLAAHQAVVGKPIDPTLLRPYEPL